VALHTGLYPQSLPTRVQTLRACKEVSKADPRRQDEFGVRVRCRDYPRHSRFPLSLPPESAPPSPDRHSTCFKNRTPFRPNTSRTFRPNTSRTFRPKNISTQHLKNLSIQEPFDPTPQEPFDPRIFRPNTSRTFRPKEPFDPTPDDLFDPTLSRHFGAYDVFQIKKSSPVPRTHMHRSAKPSV